MDLAIFPLQIIVFPGEQLNLHIFEQRYRDLFNDLKNDTDMRFGIPPVINNEIYGLGCRLKLASIIKVYPSGEMDITAEGIDIFSINQIIPKYLNKKYAAADVEIFEDDPTYNLVKFEQLQNLYDEFQSLLKQQKDFINIKPQIYSFQIAHYSGLSENQKLDLLALESEEERQEMMISHFEQIIPSMKNVEETQKRIEANGHFKNLQSFNFIKPNEDDK